MFGVQPETLDGLVREIPQGYYFPGTTVLDARGVSEIAHQFFNIQGSSLPDFVAKLRQRRVPKEMIKAIREEIEELEKPVR